MEQFRYIFSVNQFVAVELINEIPSCLSTFDQNVNDTAQKLKKWFMVFQEWRKPVKELSLEMKWISNIKDSPSVSCYLSCLNLQKALNKYLRFSTKS